MDIPKKRWLKAQKEESKFWLYQVKNKHEKPEKYKRKWRGFLDYFGKNIIIEESHSILEVGCGVSGLINYLPRGDKFALDPLVKGYIEDGGDKDNVKLIRAVGEEIPFPDNYFDLVICLNALDHTINPQKVIEESFRVVKNGGTFFLSIFVSSKIIYFYRRMKEAIGMGDPLHPFHFTEEKIITMLKDSSFEIISVDVDIYKIVSKKSRKKGLKNFLTSSIVRIYRLISPRKNINPFIYDFNITAKKP